MTLIRSSQCVINGFKMHLWNGQEEFPVVITLFSAPNYQGTYYNRASIAISNINDVENLKIQQFDENRSKRPFKLEDDMDAFKWSLPLLCSCVA